jgi:ATPase subunit of ABC transporter with duplicated ATPase domains
MLILRNISYKHPNKEELFGGLDLTVNANEKIALIGNNGSGKSTLLRIIAGELKLAGGQLQTGSAPYYIPQVFGQYNHLTVAQALGIDDKLRALNAILNGQVTEQNLQLLDNDWNIEERCNEALQQWHLHGLHPGRKLATLSGGQKTRIFLAGISIHQPRLILMDEPSNHLDSDGRKLLYGFVQRFTGTLVAISHDRTLLNLFTAIYELGPEGITAYGGNYDFYAEQKQQENDALEARIKHREKALRKARETARESMERKQKLDARGKKKQEKAGMPAIVMNGLRNSAERSTSHLKGVHIEKMEQLSRELNELRKEVPDLARMKLDFSSSALHKGRVMFTATGINCHDNQRKLWAQPLNLQVCSGERIALQGKNGSGKTTLAKIILGHSEPQQGSVYRAQYHPVYIDQEYSLIDNRLDVYEQVQQFNTGGLLEHELKIRLDRFLFTRDHWDKPCHALSGGERMRLMLCCLTVGRHAPDLLVLDEPTNNLDMRNTEILTEAVKAYEGTLIIISHDAYFLEQVHVTRSVNL